jgi:ABC-type branched-subunit amino acid transport system substrate-binding protein
MMRGARLIKTLVLLMLTAFVSACGNNGENPATARANLINRSNDNIIIGVAWTEGASDQFINGIKMAQAEINQTGIVIGEQRRKVELVFVEEASPFMPDAPRQRNYAQLIARDSAYHLLRKYPSMMGVIGHEYSSVASPASVIYEHHGLVFMSPSSMNIALTQPGFQNIFRTTVNNDVMGEQLAHFCYYNGYKRLAVLNLRNNSYSEEIVETFAKYIGRIADEKKDPAFQIIYRGSFFADQDDLRQTIAEIRQTQLDGVFIPIYPEPALRFIKQSYEMGLETTFIGDTQLESPQFEHALEERIGRRRMLEAKLNLVIPVAYNPASNMSRAFLEKFTDYYPDERLDSLAVRGYDSLKLLAYAIQDSRSMVPIVVSNTLRFMPVWMGASGVHAFSKNGEMIGKTIFFRQMQADGFTSMIGAHVPFLLDRLRARKDIAKRRRIGVTLLTEDQPRFASAFSESELTAAGKALELPAMLQAVRKKRDELLLNTDENEFQMSVQEKITRRNEGAINTHLTNVFENLRESEARRRALQRSKDGQRIPIDNPLLQTLINPITPALPHWGPYVDVTMNFKGNSVREVEKPEQLDKIGRLLEHPLLQERPLLLQVYTDNQGAPEKKLTLSRQRAEFIRDHLSKEYFINPEYLTVEGKGDLDPIATNQTEAGRKRNRRVRVSVRW